MLVLYYTWYAHAIIYIDILIYMPERYIDEWLDGGMDEWMDQQIDPGSGFKINEDKCKIS